VQFQAILVRIILSARAGTLSQETDRISSMTGGGFKPEVHNNMHAYVSE
jgi:hypothetical protein